MLPRKLTRPAPRPRSRRVLRIVTWISLTLWLFSMLPVLVWRWVDLPASALMLWRVCEAKPGTTAFRRPPCWVDLEQLPPTVPLAVIAAEDQRFAQHFGFDLKEIRAALEERRPGRKLRGASTLSQQLARNLFLWPSRSWLRKALEAYYTILLEAFWPKRRILEVYLNVVEFGPGLFGVCAAAPAYFGIPATRLSARQAALLAAVLPNPHRYLADAPSARVQRRARWIEQHMRQLGGEHYLEKLELGSDQ